MTDIASLVIKADTSQLKSANRDLDLLSNASKKAESSSEKLTSSFISMRGAISALGIGISASQIIALADSYSTMQSKLGLVAKSMEDLVAIQSRLLQIANEQRKPVTEVTELYVKAATAAKELGASQEDVFKFTEGVSAALTVNGTTTQAAAGALLQLGQAIGGTKIQMQEYNSLIDGARPLLQAIANNMDKAGGSVNKLTQQVRDGNVSSKEFFDAAVKGSAELTEKSGKMEVTVSQALTVMGNKMLTYIGYADDATGATNSLATAITDFADSTALKTGFEALAVLFLNVKYTFVQIGTEIGGIAAQIESLSRLDFSGFKNIREQMIRDAKIAREQVDLQSENILNPLKFKSEPEPVEKTSNKTLAISLSEEEIKEQEKKNKKLKELREKAVEQANKEEIKRLNVAIWVNEQIYEQQKQVTDKEIKERKDATEKIMEIEQQRANENFENAQRLSRESANEWKDAFEELKNSVDGYSKDMAKSLAQFALGGKVSFADMIDSMLLKLLEFANQKLIFDPFFKAITGVVEGSGSDSGLSGFLGSIAGSVGSFFNGGVSASAGAYSIGQNPYLNFAGARAGGGNVSPDGSYLVGERGAELFVPSSSGSIVSNGALQNKTNVTVNVIEAQGTKANVQQQQNPDGTMSISVIIEQLYGVINRDLQRGTGIAPAMERRYGLNRVAGV